ncbi:MAG: response regulator [Elusimicrobia bacterium]|nr:response regulator [Elusimicrobiota bacterium]
MTILIADDDSAILRVISRCLGRWGFCVITASTGEELLSAWKKNRCQVVLSDVQMPGFLDGLGACEIIRNMNRGVRIFFMTGDAESREKIEKKGFSLAFLKPFVLEEVRAWSRILDP